jgi:DNA-binding CsgD family transcriptional regulator
MTHLQDMGARRPETTDSRRMDPGGPRHVRDDAPVLRGREKECAALEAMIEAVRNGESRAMVLTGDAGIGKTALLDHVVASAHGMRVLRSVGVQSEMELPFAALHQLCAPVLGRLGQLPEPQRAALETVFGLSHGDVPDRLLVGLAVLGLVAEVAADRPLVCVVDDAHWLDQASAQAIAFVARRLQAESVAVVFGVREPIGELFGLPELEIPGLDADDARALLSSEVFPLDERVRERIVAETRGNPLALLELPRGLTSRELTSGLGVMSGDSLTGRIEESFRDRISALPAASQLFALIAAAEPTGDAALVWAAAARMGVSSSAATAGEIEQLVSMTERVLFRHPLVRSAIYRSANPTTRREVHLTLAAVSDQDADTERRAWHLAAAAIGPDDEVAAELERCAGRAQGRGGFVAAAAFLQRALELTRDPGQRAERALAAAQASLIAGSFDVALRMLGAAETAPLDDLQRARVDLLRGQVAFSSGATREAPRLLLAAARNLERLDERLARETYLNAWGAARFADRVGAGDLPEISRAVVALAAPAGSPRAMDHLLDGLALMVTNGRASAVPELRQATELFAREEVTIAWGWMAVTAAFLLWDDDGARVICARQIKLVRDARALQQLPFYLAALSVVTARGGDLAGADALGAEGAEVRAATGTTLPAYGSLYVAALRGTHPAAALIDATISQAGEQGQGLATGIAHWAAAVLHNGHGRYEEAVDAARRASGDPVDLHPSTWALPELIEAAVRTGRSSVAQEALSRLVRTTEPAATDFARGVEARARALVDTGGSAEACYLEAIECFGRARLGAELARTHLLYGEWLRRENRRVDGRTQLRVAHQMLSAIGMEAFAERARRELSATGETVRKRLQVEDTTTLTPQEGQIAELARAGLTNAEIGERLFISARTVEWHLRKIFVKLAISSRKELPATTPESR